MPRGKAPDKPLTLYRVFVDYDAAGISTSSSTADKKIYENRAGVNLKIRAALEMGVHPRFIQVMSITEAWTPALDYEAESSILVTCKDCGVLFDEPSDNCSRLHVILRINEARERMRASRPQSAHRTEYQPLERTHPELFVIEEVNLVD
jgi:hypothetical protein